MTKKHPFANHHKTKKKFTHSRRKCGKVTTADPRIFGPELWRSLHRIAQNYPAKPCDDAKKHTINFIKSLPYLIPCSHCGCDFLLFIQRQDLEKVVLTRMNLITFFVDAHNNVSKHLDPNKKLWTVKEAIQTYTKERGCIGNKPFWSECDIVKT